MNGLMRLVWRHAMYGQENTMHIPPRAAPYARQPEIGRSELSIGCLFTWLATAEDTAGQFALVEALVPQGAEPPPHLHTQDDEAYHTMDGNLAFTAGGKQISGNTGSMVWLPRGVEHGFILLSTQARLLILLAPGQEQAFQAPSTPAESLAFIRPTHAPSPELIHQITAQHSAYGVRFTGPPPPSPELR